MTQMTTRISLKNKEFRVGLTQLESYDLIGHTFHAELNLDKSTLLVSTENEADQSALEKTIHHLSSFHDEVSAVDEKTLHYIIKNNITTSDQKKRFSSYQQARLKAISQSKAERIQPKTKKPESVTMTDNTISDKKDLQAENAKEIEDLFTINGFVLEALKEKYKIKFSQHKSKLNMQSLIKDEVASTENLRKADEILKEVISLKQPITAKHLKEMIHIQEKRTFKPDLTKKIEDMSAEELLLFSAFRQEQEDKANRKPIIVSPKVKVKSEKRDPSYKEIHLKGIHATQKLFNDDHLKLVHAVQKIFDVKAAHIDGSQISLKPAGTITRKKDEITRNNLLVSQAGVLLTTLTEMIGADENVTPEIIAELALKQTAGAVNQEKTMKKVANFMGQPLIKSFVENLRLDEETSSEVPTVIQKLAKRETTDSILTIESRDFGKTLAESKAIKKSLETKLKVGISYNETATSKSIKIHKRANSKVDISLAENVISYAHDQYMSDVNSLDTTYFDNLIENSIQDRPLGFIDENKASEIQSSMRRDHYKLETYNPSTDENHLIYPRTDAQYELYDLFRGKPNNKRKSAGTAFGPDAKTIVIAMGPAASGKTSWATFMAVDAFKSGAVKKLYLVRPALAVGGGTPAHLPGGIKEKTAPALMPLYENLKKVMPEEEIAKFLIEATAPGSTGATKKLNDGREIEICDIERLRGRTLEGILLADELQNATEEQIRMLLGRLGPKARAYISFDLKQIDFRNKKDSGAPKTIVALYNAIQSGKAPNIGMVACNGNLRSPVVAEVLSAFEVFDNNGQEIVKRDLTVEDHVMMAKEIMEHGQLNHNKNDIVQDKRRTSSSTIEQDILVNLTADKVVQRLRSGGIGPTIGNA